MSAIDEFLSNNQDHASRFDPTEIPTPPRKKIAIVACMDARMDIHDMLGLELGDAHVMRNAGGIATDDMLRSLTISQRMLQTEEIMLIHHNKCGLEMFEGPEFAAELEAETGVHPEFDFHTFRDVDADVRESMAKIRDCPFIPHRDRVRGFVYCVDTGELREVE